MDRAGVQELVYSGTATIAQGPAGPALEGYNDAVKLYSETPDIEKAKALLAEAGVDSVDFSLTISSSSDDTVKMAQVLVAGLEEGRHQLHPRHHRRRHLGAALDGGGLRDGDDHLRHRDQRRQDRLPAVHLVRVGQHDELRLLERQGRRVDGPGLGDASTPTSAATLCQEADALLAEDAIAVPPVYPKIIVAQRNDVSVLSQSLLSVGRVDAAGTAAAGLTPWVRW